MLNINHSEGGNINNSGEERKSEEERKREEKKKLKSKRDQERKRHRKETGELVRGKKGTKATTKKPAEDLGKDGLPESTLQGQGQG